MKRSPTLFSLSFNFNSSQLTHWGVGFGRALDTIMLAPEVHFFSISLDSSCSTILTEEFSVTTTFWAFVETKGGFIFMIFRTLGRTKSVLIPFDPLAASVEPNFCETNCGETTFCEKNCGETISSDSTFFLLQLFIFFGFSINKSSVPSLCSSTFQKSGEWFPGRGIVFWPCWTAGRTSLKLLE